MPTIQQEKQGSTFLKMGKGYDKCNSEKKKKSKRFINI